MKIEFEKIRITNFLSIGNDSIELLLNKSPSTLITATNGCGKCLDGETLIDIEIDDEFIKNKFQEFIKYKR